MKNNFVCGFCDCVSQGGKDSNALSCFTFLKNSACNLAIYNLYFQAVQVIWQQICNVFSKDKACVDGTMENWYICKDRHEFKTKNCEINIITLS